MSADVWFKRDVQNALHATAEAGRETVSLSGEPSYERGYAAAIRTMALIFGISPNEVLQLNVVYNPAQLGRGGNGY